MGSGGLISGTHTEFTGSARGLLQAVKEGKAGVNEMTAFLEQKVVQATTKAERAQDTYNKSIERLAADLRGGGATAELGKLADAYQKATERGKLTAVQMDNVASKVKSLAAAGGTVPPIFATMTQNASAFGAALEGQVAAGAQAASSNLGGLGTILQSLGPGGVAAAVGLAALGVSVGITVKGLQILGQSAQEAVAWGSRIADISARTDIGAESLQKFDFAASLVGGSLESLTASGKKLDQALTLAPEKFKALGLEAEHLKQLAPEQQFVEVAQALEGVEERSKRNAIAMSIFGKNAKEVAVILKAFGDGAGNRAVDLGLVLGDSVIADLDRVDDAVTTLSSTWEGLWRNIGAGLVASPGVAAAINSIADVVGIVSKGIQDAIPVVSQWGDTLGSVVADTIELFGDLNSISKELFGQSLGQLLTSALVNSSKTIQQFKESVEELKSILEFIGTAKAIISDTEAPKLTSKVRDPFKVRLPGGPALAGEADRNLLDRQVAAHMKELKEAEDDAAAATKLFADRLSELGHIDQKAIAKDMDLTVRAIEAMDEGFAGVSDSGLDKFAKKYAATASAIPFLLEKVRRSTDSLFQPMAEGLLGEAIPINRSASADMGKLASLELVSSQHELNAVIGKGTGLWTRYGDVVETELDKANDGLEKAKESTTDWSQVLQDVTNTMQVLGISSSSVFGKVVGGFAAGSAAGDSFMKATTTSGELMSLAQGFGGIISSAKGKSNGAGALAGGVQGAAFGMQAGGPIGAGIGAGVGAIIGGLTASLTRHATAFNHVGKQWGIQISEGLGKQIDADAEKIGDIEAAALTNLSDIIGEAGGVEKFGLEKANKGMHDLFSMIETGKLTTAEAGQAFDEAFGAVAAANISKTTGIASAQLQELVGMAKDFGIESPALMEFMRGQATSLTSNLSGGLSSLKAGREKGGAGLVSQGAATGFATGVVGDFDQLLASGASITEALEAITPAVKAMREELNAAGFDGGAAFEALEGRISIVTGEITGPLVSGVGAFAGALVNMNNLGMLTQETFGGITAQIGANIAALATEGVEGPAAIAALQPSLQQVWELQQRTGYAVDETTQSLIDQGVQAGAIGEAHRSAADKMLEASERTAKAVEYLAEKFGYLAQQVNSVPSNKDINFNYTASGSVAPPGGGFTDGSAPAEEIPQFAGGSDGLINFGEETIAALHGYEAVLTRGQLAAMQTSTFSAGVAAASSSTGAQFDAGAIVAEIRALNRNLERNGERTVTGMRDAVLQLPQRR